MALNPATTARLTQVWQAAQAAPHGTKADIYRNAAKELNMSEATLHRNLGKVAQKPDRKRRSDAGSVTLPREEAVIISAYLQSSLRKTHKRLLSIGQAVETLVANGEIRAERTDPATGEVTRLSDAAIASALRTYGLHPDQLARATPAVELRSLHPNHVWQIDASLCVLYYLNARTEREQGLQVMERERFYKNKPANLKRIEADRVWSYEWTDHNASAIGLRYVMGAESAANITDCFIYAMQARAENEPFHGVPQILMMDMGSANTSGLFLNLLRRLGVKPMPHAAQNARATGQVEKSRDIIERSFESSLRLCPVNSLEELNDYAARWSRWYNSTKVHSRHGKTRYDQWLTIRQDQLRIAPSPEVCQQLLTHTPQERKVSVTLTVSFKGEEYDVRSLPGVMVGEKVMVAINPYKADSACIVYEAADGAEVLHDVPVVDRLDDGFRADANVIGEDWKRAPETALDANRKEVNRAIYDATTDEQAEAAAKAKAVPFGGRIDPFKPIKDAAPRTWMPRRGDDLVINTTLPQVAPPKVLNDFETAQALTRIGVEVNRELLAQVRAWYPEGVPETELADLQARLTTRSGLRVVAGGAS